jgi:hypothetical protein
MSLRRLRITLVALVALVTFAGSTGTGWAAEDEVAAVSETSLEAGDEVAAVSETSLGAGDEVAAVSETALASENEAALQASCKGIISSRIEPGHAAYIAHLTKSTTAPTLGFESPGGYTSYFAGFHGSEIGPACS